MKPLLRKISAVFFLALSILPVLLVLFFSVKQEIIRWEMMERLEKEHLSVIEVPAASLVWKNKSEVWIEGRLFDVHTSTQTGPLFVLEGLYDEEETELARKQRTASESETEETELLSSFLKYLQEIYAGSKPGDHFVRFATARPATRLVDKLTHPYISSPTPPPLFG